MKYNLLIPILIISFSCNLSKNAYKVKKDNNVIEIGSGMGNLVPYFIEHGFLYTELDFSADMVALAESKNPNASFLQGICGILKVLMNPIKLTEDESVVRACSKNEWELFCTLMTLS